MKVEDLGYMPKAILGLLTLLTSNKYLHRLKFLEIIYARLWNPINYAIIGGIGVALNMLIAWFFWTFLPMNWWLINLVAIVGAWTWNWLNSVGPLGYLWGFKKKEQRND